MSLKFLHHPERQTLPPGLTRRVAADPTQRVRKSVIHPLVVHARLVSTLIWQGLMHGRVHIGCTLMVTGLYFPAIVVSVAHILPATYMEALEGVYPSHRVGFCSARVGFGDMFHGISTTMRRLSLPVDHFLSLVHRLLSRSSLRTLLARTSELSMLEHYAIPPSFTTLAFNASAESLATGIVSSDIICALVLHPEREENTGSAIFFFSVGSGM